MKVNNSEKKHDNMYIHDCCLEGTSVSVVRPSGY